MKVELDANDYRIAPVRIGGRPILTDDGHEVKNDTVFVVERLESVHGGSGLVYRRAGMFATRAAAEGFVIGRVRRA